VPVDDTTTITYQVQAEIRREGPYTLECKGLRSSERGVFKRIEDGWWGIPSNDQDRIAQESQGLIFDRSREYLGTSDASIVAFRKLLLESIQAVEHGKDPINVVRDDSDNELIKFDVDMNFSDGTDKAPEIIIV
jgi:hypothetical protein